MRKNLPFTSLDSWRSIESFRQRLKTALGAANHGGEQSEGFAIGKLDDEEENP